MIERDESYGKYRVYYRYFEDATCFVAWHCPVRRVIKNPD